MVRKTRLILLAIILLTIFLRVYKLNVTPPGFANDEAAIAYQSYSILQTGKDTWSNTWPLLSFKDFGEYLPPFSVYSIVPSIYILGLNEFAMRLPFAITAILAIIPLFILTKTLFKNERIALVACLLFALSPINIGWSRFVYEGNFGMLFYLLAITFFVLGAKNSKYYLLSIASFGLTLTTYHIYYFLSPITALLLFLPKQKVMRSDKKLFFAAFIVTALVASYYLLIVGSGSGRERFRQVSIFTRAETLDRINIQRSYCQSSTPHVICKLTFNKLTAYTYEYANNYLFHLSPTYLGLNGSFLRGTILPKHGLIYPFEVFFFYLAIVLLIKKRNQTSYLLLVWTALYPAANSFTGTGEISRITHAAPLFSILSAYGIYSTYQWFKGKKYQKVALASIFMLAAFNVFSFMVNYFAVFPKENSKNGGYAYVELFKRLKSERQNYQRIFITNDYLGGSPQFQARIFLPVEPQAFQDPTRNEYEIVKPQNYIDYTRLDNIYMPKSFDNVEFGENDLLVVGKQQKLPGDSVLFEIKEPSGEVSFFGVKRITE